MKDPEKVKQGKRNKNKGNERELKTRSRLRLMGYYCVKAGASKGIWDLWADNEFVSLRIQVKSNKWAPPKEKRAMEDYKCPKWVLKLQIMWPDRARVPRIRLWSPAKRDWLEIPPDDIGNWKLKKEKVEDGNTGLKKKSKG